MKEHQEYCTPLIHHFMNTFALKVEASTSIEAPQVEINEAFIGWVNGLNNWELIGMETMTIWMKSTIAGFSMIAGRFEADRIQKAAYL